MEIAGLEKMQKEAARFAAQIAPQAREATVVTLSGDLGAGKTSFAQGIARALGVEEQVTSPTFVIEKIYSLKAQKFARLVHVDAYRLNGSHELKVLGFEEILRDSGNLVVVEWPENVADIIPENAIRILLSGLGAAREISYN